jgi:hypothetical protein
LKEGGVQRKEKEKENVYCELKSLFFFPLQWWFLEIGGSTPITFEIIQNES